MKLFKRVLFILFALSSLFIVSDQTISSNSCNSHKNTCINIPDNNIKTDEEKVMEAVNNITFDKVIVDDIHFPTSTINNVSISWNSNKPDIISNDGIVNRPYNDYVEVNVDAIFSLPKFEYTKTYTFYVLPQYNDEGIKHPLSEEWLNNLNFDREINSITLENKTYNIYIDDDYINASRIYTEENIANSFVRTNMYIYTSDAYHSGGWKSVTQLSSDLKKEIISETNKFFLKEQFNIFDETGINVDSHNYSWDYIKSGTMTTYFENNRTIVDNDGFNNYIGFTLVRYILYTPIKIEEFSEFNLFDTSYTIHTNTLYVLFPMQRGICMKWEDGIIQNWHRPGNVTIEEFYDYVKIMPSSFRNLY